MGMIKQQEKGQEQVGIKREEGEEQM